MSLASATHPDGRPLSLAGAAPFAATELVALVGVPFDLDPGDPFVLEGGTEAHGYLDLARNAWVETPEWMDFLDPESPAHHLKLVERAMYLHHWAPFLEGVETVMDIGCGVGRLTTALLDRGLSVWGVDADLASLHRLAWRAAGRQGRLDLHWSSAHALPEVQVDCVVACEVLCYVPDVARAVAAAVARLKPGGVLLLSMEARWGWACSPDVTPGTVAHALVGDGVVDVAESGWTQTWEEAPLRELLEGAGLVVEAMIPTHYVLDGPLEAATDGIPGLEALLDLEQAARVHPVWAPLNRIWTVAARKA